MTPRWYPEQVLSHDDVKEIETLYRELSSLRRAIRDYENAVEREREACIAACESQRPDWHDTGDGQTDSYNGGIYACIEAIRARGETK